MTEAILLYITTEDKQEAQSIGKALVEEKLVACVNIMENMQAMFWWKDKVDKASETVLIAKTKKSLLSEVIEKINSMHSYECPCVIALPIIGGNESFLQWIQESTKNS